MEVWQPTIYKISSRLVGGAETSSWGREDAWQGNDWEGEAAAGGQVTHLCADKQGGITREQDRLCNPGFQPRELKTQNLWL